MLYVPPRIPHWGLAVGESMTYSLVLECQSIDLLNSFSIFS